MDPRVEFGRPILKVSAVPTAVIADRYKAGESIADHQPRFVAQQLYEGFRRLHALFQLKAVDPS